MFLSSLIFRGCPRFSSVCNTVLAEMLAAANFGVSTFYHRSPFLAIIILKYVLYDDHIEQLLFAVLNHTLEVRTIGSTGRHGAVDVVGNDRDAAFFSKGHALTQLTFDALLSLIVGGIPGVDNSCHVFTFFFSE